MMAVLVPPLEVTQALDITLLLNIAQMAILIALLKWIRDK
jgi:hypothetical protein